jgi:hypothetical protein
MIGVERGDLLATQQELLGEGRATRFALRDTAIEDLKATGWAPILGQSTLLA